MRYILPVLFDPLILDHVSPEAGVVSERSQIVATKEREAVGR